MMEKNDSSDPALFHVQCKIMQRQIAALLILEEESWDKMTIEGEEPEQNFSVSAFAIADKWIGGTKNRALVVGEDNSLSSFWLFFFISPFFKILLHGKF